MIEQCNTNYRGLYFATVHLAFFTISRFRKTFMSHGSFQNIVITPNVAFRWPIRIMTSDKLTSCKRFEDHHIAWSLSSSPAIFQGANSILADILVHL